MPDIKKEVYKDLLNRYNSRLEHQLDGKSPQDYVPETRDYTDFKKEIIPPHMNAYEKLCNLSEKILNLKPDAKQAAKLQESINTVHLLITPTGAFSFAVLFPIFFILIGSMLAYLVFTSLAFVGIIAIIGLILILPLSSMPNFLATYWRLKASNQMVLSIFYVVTYMRHTSNLENAIQFASEHLTPPLSLDLKKIIWDVETEKYSSVKESLDSYLQTWRKYNMEFVEAFHLITSSLFESDETRRLSALDRALDVILEETYEKMLHYAHNLKSPITMLHMLGVILPILGLVILPLMVSFIPEVTWLHLLFFYNILLPVIVYVMGRSILTKRPTGYGDTDISEENPELKKYKKFIWKIGKSQFSLDPVYVAVTVAAIFMIIGISPILVHTVAPTFEYPSDPYATFHFLEYREVKQDGIPVVNKNGQPLIKGPYGLYSSIASLAVTLSVGLGFGLYFKLRSKNIMKIRNKTKQLEDEFASSLFQLGNRLGDDIPAEMAFARVADYMQDTNSGKFFRLVNINIQKLGMGVKQAIFDPRYGALLKFPSKIIESSMKVLIESIRKGPRIAAQSLTNVARYIKEIHRVNERLRDLMADIISSMTSQIKFLSPAISGIVIGITSMITTILAALTDRLSDVTASGADIGGAGGIGELAGLFGLGIPTYFFQIVVGIYVVQIVYILTVLSNGIQNGSDKLNERYSLGNNLINSTVLYCIISLAVMLLFNFIAASILKGAF